MYRAVPGLGVAPDLDITNSGWPRSFLTTVKAAGEAWQARVAPIAKLGTPGNLIIVAHAAEFSVDDISHGNVVAARPHFETIFIMAHIASKAQAVKPVGKYHRCYPFLFCPFVEHHVAILPTGYWCGQYHTDQQYDQPLFYP